MFCIIYILQYRYENRYYFLSQSIYDDGGMLVKAYIY